MSARAVVQWRAAARGWFRAQGMEEFTIGVAGTLPRDATEEQLKNGFRYVVAGIESTALKDAITADAKTGPEAWAFIEREFLHGRDEQTILHELLTDCGMEGRDTSALKYRFEFQQLAKALFPPLPDSTLCAMFASKIPAEFDSIVHVADLDPGRGNYLEFIRAVSQNINAHLDRQTTREIKHQALKAAPARKMNRTSALSTHVDDGATSDSDSDDGDGIIFRKIMNQLKKLSPEGATKLVRSLAELETHAGSRKPDTKDQKGGRHSWVCFNCGKEGHMSSECNERLVRCKHPLCGRKGHLPQYCWYYHPEKCWDREKREAIEQELKAAQKVQTMRATANEDSEDSIDFEEWYAEYHNEFPDGDGPFGDVRFA